MNVIAAAFFDIERKKGRYVICKDMLQSITFHTMQGVMVHFYDTSREGTLRDGDSLLIHDLLTIAILH